MDRKYLIFGAMLVLMISLVTAVTWTPQGDINLKSYYNIFGAVDINSTEFYQDGNQVLDTSGGYFNSESNLTGLLDDNYRADSWDNFTGIPTATPSSGDTTHLSTADQIYDYIVSLAYATTSYVNSLGNWSQDKSSYWNTSTDLDTVIATDEITELKIDFNTVCGEGNHLYVNGNNLACEADDDTTYTAGDGITLTATQFNHTDTSNQASSNNAGRTYIQDIILDTYGHITSIVTATETVTDTDTQDLSYNATTDVISLVDGGSIDITEVDTHLSEDQVEAYILDSDNTANLDLNNYNIYNVSNYTGDKINVTCCVYLGTIQATDGNSISVQPTDDTDDFFSFKTPASRPTIKREGGKYIYFESSNVYDVGISFREDATYSGTLNYEKDNHRMTMLGKNSPLGFKANSEYYNFIEFETYNHQPQISVYNGTLLKINDSLEVVGDLNITGDLSFTGPVECTGGSYMTYFNGTNSICVTPSEFLLLTGGTMTGNLNITGELNVTENIYVAEDYKVCFNSACTSYTYFNGTHTIRT